MTTTNRHTAIPANPLLSDRFADALQLGCELHCTQTRKGGDVPYIAHLLAVTSLVLEMGGCEDEAIAAALHDAIEDGNIGGLPGPSASRTKVASLIRERFGESVLNLVREVTEDDPSPDATSDERRASWKNRKESYLGHLTGTSAGAFRIALADKLHNARAALRDPAGDRWSKYNSGREQQRWWYENLAQAFRDRLDGMANGEARLLAVFVDEFSNIVTSLFINTEHLLGEAFAVAAVAHRHDRDKAGATYMLHLLEVMRQVQHLGEAAQIAAVLHDLREDCDTTWIDLEDFGTAVNECLDLLNHRKEDDYLTAYIPKIASHALAREIKLADLNHNSDLRRMPLDRERTPKDFARTEKYHKAALLLRDAGAGSR